jgi:hypothetical protein
VELLQRDPRNIDIEHIEETDEHVVEMASPRNSFTLSGWPAADWASNNVFNEI